MIWQLLWAMLLCMVVNAYLCLMFGYRDTILFVLYLYLQFFFLLSGGVLWVLSIFRRRRT